MADSPVDVVLARLKDAKRSGAGWIARCPAHDDNRASLSIASGEAGRALVHCHAGCELGSILGAVGLEVRDTFAEEHSNGNGSGPKRVIAEYTYHDEGGLPLYQVVRYEPKDFRQRASDGIGGWRWSMKGVTRVPYRLPAVLKAVKEGRGVVIVEGEKDADRLAELGICGTTNAGGSGKWGDELCGHLEGARVVIVPDNDEPGRRHAEDVAERLTGIAAEVRLLQLPDLPEKGDISDWLAAGQSAEEFKRLAKSAPTWDEIRSGPEGTGDSAAETSRKIPPALSVRELMEVPEPEESWIASGLIPGGANILMAAYPKSFKTFTCLELAVSAITQAEFLDRFPVPRQHNVGMILMEGSTYRTKVRLDRICRGKGCTLDELDGRFRFWFRPPLKLSHAGLMQELSAYIEEYELDLLMIDNWSYVSTGNSNDSDEVTPQLDALSALRAKWPNLSTLLVHHARKTTADASADRLTDIIRNSSAFGAWYDLGLVLARKDELSPVTVRAELRDHPSPEAFAFHVKDELPADPDAGRMYPGGWLRLTASDKPPALVQRETELGQMMVLVADYLTVNNGSSRTRLREGIAGDNRRIDAAFEQLCAEGYARHQEAKGPGTAGRCWLNYSYPERQKVQRPGPWNNVPHPAANPAAGNPAYPAAAGSSSPLLRPPVRGQQRGADARDDFSDYEDEYHRLRLEP